MTQAPIENPAAYAEALHQGAAVWTPPDAGVLRLLDADRVGFLQRVTTNDIKALRPGASCVTGLTSPTPRRSNAICAARYFSWTKCALPDQRPN